jgi:hypothetical protein
MLRGGEPILDDLRKPLGGIAGVRDHHPFQQRVLAARHSVSSKKQRAALCGAARVLNQAMN